MCLLSTGACMRAGLSLYDVQLQVRAVKMQKKTAAALRQAFLFTHRGYSGPAVLDLSHHAVMALDRHTPPPGLPPDGVAPLIAALIKPSTEPLDALSGRSCTLNPLH